MTKSKMTNVDRTHMLMLLPYLLVFSVFIVIPVIAALVLGFTDFDMVQMPHFVGFQNYVRMFLDDVVFIKALQNTIVFAVITGPLSYVMCLMLAWLVNEMERGVRSVLTFCLYIPSMMTGAYGIWAYIFSGDRYGLLNSVLIKLGVIIEPIQFLTDSKYIMTCVIIVQLWLSLGTSFLSFLAGLQGVDRQLYEAAAIDGISNRLQEFWFVTLPGMGPQLLFGAVMQIGASFAAGSVGMQLLQAAGATADGVSTDYAATTIVTHMTDVGSTYLEMGYACAIATVLFVAMFAFNHVIQKILRKFADL